MSAENRMHYTIRPGIHMAEQDGEMVLLHLERDEYLSADEFGSEVLRVISAGGSLADLIDDTARSYGVAGHVVRADVEEFLERCVAARIIERVTA